jgi:tetratricopeptide (TPR) repeat protein
MIARLKQTGDPATPARPVPAQPEAPATTPDGATDSTSSGSTSADPISADPTGSTRTMIWKAQNELKRIGIDPGPADGNLRKRTTYAIQTYQRARGLPDDGRISEELLARLEAETASATPTPSEAEPLGSVTLQSAAMTAVPQNGYQAFRAGYSAAQTGDFDAAIKLYDRAVDSGDLALEHLAAALYNRANALQYLGVLDKAIEDYSAAIANKPGFPAAYYNRGFAFDSKGEQIRAIEDYRKARDLGLQRLGVRSPDLPPPQF